MTLKELYNKADYKDELGMCFKGDCLDIMKNIPDNSVDMILTDPPYKNENHGGGQTELAQRKLVKDLHIDFISNGFNYEEIFTQMLRICKIPNFFIFCSNKQISTIMGYFESKKLSTTLLVWNKTNPAPLCNGKYLSDCEFIVYVRGKGATFNNNTPFDYKKKCFISSIVPNKTRFHPTEKPIDLLTQYILLHSNKNSVIIDPFMGSGSTCVACKNTNRRYIGIELDKKYFDIAVERIKNI
jgi:DNA modification methylase